MVNAMVSHEMRNPLNSIIAQNIEKRNLLKLISEQVTRLKQNSATSDAVSIIESTICKLDHGLTVQESATDVLNYIV